MAQPDTDSQALKWRNSNRFYSYRGVQKRPSFSEHNKRRKRPSQSQRPKTTSRVTRQAYPPRPTDRRTPPFIPHGVNAWTQDLLLDCQKPQTRSTEPASTSSPQKRVPNNYVEREKNLVQEDNKKQEQSLLEEITASGN
ncbi:hypothetical protein Q5P01_026103 [Channa striata]|uniref:Uncharacterized protein n=1 Tax=Channa striata TaxID=64152 RepID=A0AA88IJB5_CHASR|nr:hypothetical protein Q5P01_026103 [Channa striata]